MFLIIFKNRLQNYKKKIIYANKSEKNRKNKEKCARACVYQKKVVPLHPILCVMQQILIVIGLVAVAMVLLSVGVIFRKDHRFRSQHIHENERMKQDHIHCALAEDKLARRKKKVLNR